MALSEDRLILALRPDDLEDLVKKWIAQEASAYVGFERNSGSGDRGLDAVGFCSPARYRGDWHNFQCKQLGVTLKPPEFFGELGKVLYHASRDRFVPPCRYVFVAPNGVASAVRDWVDQPDRLKAELLANWTQRCSKKIVSGKSIPLDAALEATLRGFDFSNVETWNVHKLVEQPHMRKVMTAHLDMDPGEAPEGVVPPQVDEGERVYVSQLVEVYRGHGGTPFADHEEVAVHPEYGPHLRDQRIRYHDAGAFRRHFRDNVTDSLVRRFDKDIYNGVVDEHRSTAGYAGVNAVLKLAGQTSVSGVFEKHRRAPVSVKQGTCHHFANDGILPWKP